MFYAVRPKDKLSPRNTHVKLRLSSEWSKLDKNPDKLILESHTVIYGFQCCFDFRKDKISFLSKNLTSFWIQSVNLWWPNKDFKLWYHLGMYKFYWIYNTCVSTLTMTTISMNLNRVMTFITWSKYQTLNAWDTAPRNWAWSSRFSTIFRWWF